MPRASTSRIATTAKLERIALVAAATISFIATLWLAVADKSAAATVTAALTVACLAFYFLPFIDSVEAFGLKAKLRAQIGEVDQLLEDLRSMAMVSSRIIYAQLAWLGRMGSPSWPDKRKWFEELEESLAKLNVPAEKIRELKRPFLNFVSFDLYQPFEQIVRQRIQKLVAQNHAETQKQFPGAIPAGDPDYARLIADGRHLSSLLKGFENLYINPAIQRMDELVNQRLDVLPLPPEEVEILRNYGLKIAGISNRVHETGKLTTEAENSLTRHSDHKQWQEDYKTLFGEMS